MSVLQANNFAITLLCHVYSYQIIPQFYCAAILIVLHSTRLSCLASDIHRPFNSVTFLVPRKPGSNTQAGAKSRGLSPALETCSGSWAGRLDLRIPCCSEFFKGENTKTHHIMHHYSMKLKNMLPLEFEASPASALGILLSPEKLIHSPRLRIYCQMLARGGVRLMDVAEGDVVVGEPIKEEAW